MPIDAIKIALSPAYRHFPQKDILHLPRVAMQDVRIPSEGV
jgi:hypothetical protein